MKSALLTLLSVLSLNASASYVDIKNHWGMPWPESTSVTLDYDIVIDDLPDGKDIFIYETAFSFDYLSKDGTWKNLLDDPYPLQFPSPWDSLKENGVYHYSFEIRDLLTDYLDSTDGLGMIRVTSVFSEMLFHDDSCTPVPEPGSDKPECTPDQYKEAKLYGDKGYYIFVDEPSLVGLLGLGLVSMAAVRRRKGKA
ncbi:hypothetical protein EUZ85_11190 [Hahella sp. KA22]|uniref:hypothetical protein n=1 Tax=Hahella sp. KA22 TaxID=1628392 RepID=UPI000FDD9AF1|nr:hypothetical protein [Hahella sp. KA22]AZZ91262.1 hypothetical protein ENC22_08635 [Hahella sp. KA22]QAY54630.1 hypothetical protein EUZ85_11190 [Hahella sp. KA22]